MEKKVQEQNVITEVAPVEITPEQVAERVAALNEASYDSYRRAFIINEPIANGLVLTSVAIRPFVSRKEENPNAKARIVAFLELKFNNALLNRGFRLMEVLQGEYAGKMFVKSKADKVKDSWVDDNVFVVKGSGALVSGIVSRLYQGQRNQQNQGPQTIKL